MIRAATVVIAIVLAATMASAQQARDTGVLAGVIRTDDGTPVRRAIVRLNGSDQAGTRVAVSDDAGRFAFGRLAAGSFTVSASRAGYVTAFYGSKRPGRGPALPIALSAGQRSSIDLVLLRGAAIEGIITDQFGHPAPQVTVQAQIRGVPVPVRLTPGAQNYATTDDRGMFRIYGLAPGDYVVSAFPQVTEAADSRLVTSDDVRWALQQLSSPASASPPSGPAVVYAPVYFPGTFTPDDATTITLRAGADQQAASFALRLAPTARLSGIVSIAGGQAASDAVVMLLPKAAGSAPALQAMIDAGLTIAPRIQASADGRFTLSNVTPGQYVLLATNATLAGAERGVTAFWGETDVAVNGRDLSDLAVTMQPGAKLSGRIVFESSSLAPTADSTTVQIALSPRRYGATPIANAVGVVTSRGTFAVSGLMPGPYVFKATVPGGTPGAARWILKSVVISGRDVADGTLDCHAGEEVNDVVVTFTDKETEISGTLLDAADRPTAAFSIVVFTTNRTLWTADSRRVRSVRPATNGTFRLVGLPAGEYNIVAVADLEQAALSDPAYLEQLQGAALKITLGEGEKKKQDFKIPGGV